MQADEALRHCMLKHFGTNQSCEIKVLEVTQFCQEKKKQPNTKRQQISWSSEIQLCFYQQCSSKEVLGLKVFAVCKTTKKGNCRKCKNSQKNPPWTSVC